MVVHTRSCGLLISLSLSLSLSFSRLAQANHGGMLGFQSTSSSYDKLVSMESDQHLSPPVPKYSKELQTAVQDDVRRQEVDSAKKRAAAQNVDYENFAALVSMAHVKPFERRRGQQEEVQKHVQVLPAWSFDASGALAPSDSSQISLHEQSGGEANKKRSSGLSLMSKTEKSKGNRILSEVLTDKCGLGCNEARGMTADAFKREWRRVGSNLQDKLKFLLALLPGDLSKLFKAELPPSILTDVIDVLCWWKGTSSHEKAKDLASSLPHSHAERTSTHDTGYSGARKSAPQETFDVVVAFQILSSLCVCGRFSLSLELVGSRVQLAAVQLIEQLVECLERKEICEERANEFSSMCSFDPHVHAMVEYPPKGLPDNRTEMWKEQRISKDDLKQLASVYSRA